MKNEEQRMEDPCISNGGVRNQKLAEYRSR